MSEKTMNLESMDEETISGKINNRKTTNEKTAICNEDMQVEKISDILSGKSIALCITGGIAAIETPKIARQLRRHGASVKAYMTPTSLDFIGQASLEWATGSKVITKLSGLAEHICIDDLVLVAPATLNTINKICYGIADNPVTTLAASAMGCKIPIYIAPTMHESLYKNPILQENLKNAKKYSLTVIEPRLGEHKAKLPKVSAIVNAVVDYFSNQAKYQANTYAVGKGE